MPGCDARESQRLPDGQHYFSRALAHGCLIQPFIPHSNLQKIADVATGTGIWLREVAEELTSSIGPIHRVGFDISEKQLPKDTIQDVEFVVHDVAEPFPQQYHGYFDLVHVRLLRIYV